MTEERVFQIQFLSPPSLSMTLAGLHSNKLESPELKTCIEALTEIQVCGELLFQKHRAALISNMERPMWKVLLSMIAELCSSGFGNAVTKKFTANVTSGTLEIRLFWAGKGTTGVPYRGDYGPLISAISIDSDFPPPQETQLGGGSSGISAGAVVGIVAGGVFIILLVLGILWWKGFIGPANTLEQDLKGVDLQTSRFTLRQIKVATKNFDISNKIGEGGFGPVYKGLLSDDTAIAVKKLSAKSKQGNREFVNDIGMIFVVDVVIS